MRFLIRFPIITALVFALPLLLPSSDAWMIRATTQSLAAASLFMPSETRVVGSTFAIGETAIRIVPDCTSLFPTMLFVGGILAFPAPWRLKAAGVVAGAVLLWLYNMLRIYLLMAVLRYAPAHFDLVHVYLWQSVTLLVVVAGFLRWLRLAEARSPQH